ncbi:MAG: NAD(P)-dependent oxidoreductase [Candidatus Omnitrophica bacterium]|nr:NAD(P)-dependent oxidoreductase [Candidatus Omnitrophota bacterium]MBU4488360.1 NAD(P)-dependent oxidoreductase [Candidatus Omnitrophota bacterium]MCG2704870.1 NAD(P)-dependent oxidoreductase [Candidatus Omnitrophota bacterium]
MKILLIGSEGFIGRFLRRKLAEKGHNVMGMDMNGLARDRQFTKGNVTNINDIMKAAAGVDLIINLAAEHHDFGVKEEEFFEVNTKGMQNVLDCATKLGIKKILFYSTAAVYGPHAECVSESTVPTPVSPYGKSKLEAEKLIHDWAGADKAREAAIIRPVVVFGPENYANMYNLIDTIHRKRFFFVGKGENIKSVAYVENLADATIFLLEHMKPGVEVCNYSDYPQMNIRETAETIYKCLLRDIPKVNIPLGPALAAASIFDILGKITGYNFPITAFRIKKFNTQTYFASDRIRELGFKQRITPADGLKNMVEWYLKRLREVANGVEN